MRLWGQRWNPPIVEWTVSGPARLFPEGSDTLLRWLVLTGSLGASLGCTRGPIFGRCRGSTTQLAWFVAAAMRMDSSSVPSCCPRRMLNSARGSPGRTPSSESATDVNASARYRHRTCTCASCSWARRERPRSSIQQSLDPIEPKLTAAASCRRLARKACAKHRVVVRRTDFSYDARQSGEVVLVHRGRDCGDLGASRAARRCRGG